MSVDSVFWIGFYTAWCLLGPLIVASFVGAVAKKLNSVLTWLIGAVVVALTIAVCTGWMGSNWVLIPGTEGWLWFIIMVFWAVMICLCAAFANEATKPPISKSKDLAVKK